MGRNCCGDLLRISDEVENFGSAIFSEGMLELLSKMLPALLSLFAVYWIEKEADFLYSVAIRYETGVERARRILRFQ